MEILTGFLNAAINAALWGCIIGLFWSWYGDRIIFRISPSYAAKCRIRKLQRRDSGYIATLRDDDPLLNWAKNHLDEPIAQALLDGEAETDLLNSQLLEDEYNNESERASRRAKSELRNKQLLKWALDNPYSPTGNRHLRETLVKLREQLGWTQSSIEGCQRILDFDHLPDDRRKNFADDLTEARAKRRALEQSITEIELALGVDAMHVQE